MFIMLSDFSTYDSKAYYVSLNKEGLNQLEETSDMKLVDAKNYKICIPIADLIAAYNKLHRTNY
jgi:hypothetical protein